MSNNKDSEIGLEFPNRDEARDITEGDMVDDADGHNGTEYLRFAEKVGIHVTRDRSIINIMEKL